jgi:8-oxo-dGTP pyrophosphatase MutT (NUDIX family)
MNNNGSWKRLARNTFHDTRFLKVHEDTVELPDGSVINDYSVMTLPDGVLVVATDENDKLILFREYKYAIDKMVLSFPAGGMDGDESPVEAAARELIEETGYGGGEVEYLAPLSVYPSKMEHITHIVRVKNAKKITDVKHEATEAIGEIELVSPDQISRLIKERQFDTTYMLAGLALAFPARLTPR